MSISTSWNRNKKVKLTHKLSKAEQSKTISSLPNKCQCVWVSTDSVGSFPGSQGFKLKKTV